MAKHGYPQPSHPPLPSHAMFSKFADISSVFHKLLASIMDAFDQTPNSLSTLKELLNQLVLPLDDGEIVPLVDSKIYKQTVATRELFRLVSPYFNCLSPHLIKYLCEESLCLPAVAAVRNFTAVHDQHIHSVLCIQESHDDQLSDLDVTSLSAPLSPGHLKAHALPLNKLQSEHPLLFQMPDYHKVQSSEPLHTVWLSVEVDRSFLTLQNYDDITNAVSAVLLLPNLALVYAGCFSSLIVLVWLVPAELMPYFKDPPFGCTASGDRLLAEQGVVTVAIGDDSWTKCLTLKVCLDLHRLNKM